MIKSVRLRIGLNRRGKDTSQEIKSLDSAQAFELKIVNFKNVITLILVACVAVDLYEVKLHTQALNY